MTSITTLLSAFLLASQCLAWEALPSIPSGRRSQFLVLQDGGAYKFGYDTGSGIAHKQEGDAANEVKGHYFYNSGGQRLDLKYTSGVGGFQPEGLEKLQELVKSSAPSAPSTSYLPAAQAYSSPSGDDSGAYTPDNSGDYQPDNSGEYVPDQAGQDHPDNSGEYKGDQEPQGDASYNFNVDTPSYKRNEVSDAGGNVRGSYSYSNKEGTHDLQYVAGTGTGFVATSGSLSQPNGLRGAGAGGYQAPNSAAGYSYSSRGAAPKGTVNPDRSYSFGFSTNDQSRQESGDANGNVQGRYSYQNSAGSHDLSFKAGSETGFLITGGSLATPNGVAAGAAAAAAPTAYSAPSSYSAGVSPSITSSSTFGDGSYSFGFSTSDQTRQEHSDANGNVRGSFSYHNAAGNHDLSYVAGSSTGFLPTGGSLTNPNGLKGAAPSASAALSGYAYTAPQAYSPEGSEDDQADTGDSSYNFSFDTPEYSRQESSDPHGNVQGSFSYKNKAGSNDLSFVAGSATGFQPTGGSLSSPNGLNGKSVPVSSPNAYTPPSSHDSVEVAAARTGGYSPSGVKATSGDASYSFGFDTAEYNRREHSDASGNVQGSFSYRNAVGSHDLSFVAGSATGFQPTGGSLAAAPGLSEPQLRAGYRSGGASPVTSFVGSGVASYQAAAAPVASAFAPVTQQDTKASYHLGNVKVHTYLPPSNVKHKYGYIFEAQ